MPAVEKHQPGAPCWFELGTSDQNGADAYYKQVFGWEVRQTPLPFGGHYSIYQLEGRDVGAAYTLMPDMVAQGIPPHWMVYFSTDDADATAKRAAELGGKVIKDAFDVMEYGRMAVCADPEGAVFSLWQPKAHIGARVYGDTNTVCWVELASRNIKEAANFYAGLFGWDAQHSNNPHVPYIEFKVGGAKQTGGMLQMNEQFQGMPANWSIYICVTDLEKTVEQIRKGGGKVMHGPFEAPSVGTIAVVADPQGAISQVIQLTAHA